MAPASDDTKTFVITTFEIHPDHLIKGARLPACNHAKLVARLVLPGG